jgi:hypothetical protein
VKLLLLHGGVKDDRCGAGTVLPPADEGGEGVTVERGHHDVEDDDVRTVLADECGYAQRRAGRNDVEAPGLEVARGRFEDLGVVVHEKHDLSCPIGHQK